jgi:methylmalonyl-CoA/ethylmalonyl-CoA epimerase
MKKIEHIGIAVKKLSVSIPLFEKLLDVPCYKTEVVETEQVNTAFFKNGETKIELVEAYAPGSVINSFIEKKGEGLHHIAFEVDDIDAEVKRLVNAGFTLINETPKEGADNKLVCFLHPKSTNGVLIELCMEKKISPLTFS